MGECGPENNAGSSSDKFQARQASAQVGMMMRVIKIQVVIGPQLRVLLSGDTFELADAAQGQIFTLLPAQARGDLIAQILTEIGGIPAQQDGRALGQFDE